MLLTFFRAAELSSHLSSGGGRRGRSECDDDGERTAQRSDEPFLPL